MPNTAPGGEASGEALPRQLQPSLGWPTNHAGLPPGLQLWAANALAAIAWVRMRSCPDRPCATLFAACGPSAPSVVKLRPATATLPPGRPVSPATTVSMVATGTSWVCARAGAAGPLSPPQAGVSADVTAAG